MFKSLDIIYNHLFDILNTDSVFTYFKTKEKGFFAREDAAANSQLYPWGFIEYPRISGVDAVKFPTVFRYIATFPLVVMTYADRGDVDKLIFNDQIGNPGTEFNVNPGIGDIIQDVGTVYWDSYKVNKLGITTFPTGVSVTDWTFSFVGDANVSQVQALTAIHPYIRASQIDFAITVTENTVFDMP